MDKIVVFGATGNIGVYFVDYLQKNVDHIKFSVVAVGRKKTAFFENQGVEYVNVDIRNKDDFERLPQENVYAVVNLAGILPAYSKDVDYFTYIDTNITGGIRILEYARKCGADRVLYSQTWAEQGGYWGERDVLSPEYPRKLIYKGDHAFYAICKTTVVEAMEHYKQEFGLKNFVFVLPNVYLYHPDTFYFADGKKKLIAYRYLIERAIKGEPVELWGNPEAFKDILYIKDLCQMMYKALLTDVEGGKYNAGTGVRTTLREQIEGIIDVFSVAGKKSEIIMNPSGDTFTSFVMDIENAKRDLGYIPEYTYREYLIDYKKERELKRFDALWTGKE